MHKTPSLAWPMKRRIPIRRHCCWNSATRPRVVGLGAYLLVPRLRSYRGHVTNHHTLTTRDGSHYPGHIRWRRIGIRLSIALTGLRGAPATMERKLHGFRLYRAIYGAVAPPWRGRHGAHFAAPLGWAAAAERNPPFHSNDRASWRPRHDGAQAPRFSPLSGHLWRCRATVAGAPRSPFCGALGLGGCGGSESAFP